MDGIRRSNRLQMKGLIAEQTALSKKALRNDEKRSQRPQRSPDLERSADDAMEAGLEKAGGRVGIEDKLSMLLLLLLYTLQGIPMGLSGSVPLFLKERGVSYEGLSLFSLVSLPFSMKLLWAPLVDSCYISSIGRRKTWLIPIQMLTGVVMIVGSSSVSHWMGQDSGSDEPDVYKLSLFFFALYFLMASQDIAVDGWALTMLSRENVGYASMCNSIGQSFGYFVANQGFIALSDAGWCERHLGLAKGESLVSLPAFMTFWGWVFIVTTALIAVGKVEKPMSEEEEHGTLLQTCQQVVSICRLRSVQMLCLVLFTCKVAFSPADSISGFKLQEYGMPKADIATISPLLLVVGLVLPFVLGSAVSSRPMDMFLLGIPLKLLTSSLFWLVAQSTPQAYSSGAPSAAFFVPLIAVSILHEIAGSLIFLSQMSFFAKVSDPAIGGTYMTLLNTIANLGSKWPNSLALWILPKATLYFCDGPASGELNSCRLPEEKALCSDSSGVCATRLDGYTILTIVCTLVGILWIVIFRGYVQKLQRLPLSDWAVSNIAKRT